MSTGVIISTYSSFYCIVSLLEIESGLIITIDRENTAAVAVYVPVCLCV